MLVPAGKTSRRRVAPYCEQEVWPETGASAVADATGPRSGGTGHPVRVVSLRYSDTPRIVQVGVRSGLVQQVMAEAVGQPSLELRDRPAAAHDEQKIRVGVVERPEHVGSGSCVEPVA